MLFKTCWPHSAFNWKAMLVILLWMWKQVWSFWRELQTFSLSKEPSPKRARINSYNFDRIWIKFRQSIVTSFLLVVIDRLCGFLRSSASARFPPLPLSSVGFSRMIREPIPSFDAILIYPVWDRSIGSLVPSSLNTPLSDKLQSWERSRHPFCIPYQKKTNMHCIDLQCVL